MKQLTDEDLVQFENAFLDWISTVGIFFILGLALYSFTRQGRTWSILFFIVSGILAGTAVWDFYQRRQNFIKNDVDFRFALDVLVWSLIFFVVIDIWVIITVLGSSSEEKFTIFAHSLSEEKALKKAKRRYESTNKDLLVPSVDYGF